MLLSSVVRPIFLLQLALAVLLATLVGACAVARPPQQPTYRQDKVGDPLTPLPMPETADEAKLQFEDAERRLRGMLAGGAGTDVPPSPGPLNPSEARPTQQQTDHDPPFEDRCLIACKALASMQRSATQLCELTGQYDPRCENVRERVEAARELVFSSCPSCVVAQP